MFTTSYDKIFPERALYTIPRGGDTSQRAFNKRGFIKNAIVGQYVAISWKGYEIGPWLILNVNMMSHVPDRSMLIAMTSNDLQGVTRGARFFRRISIHTINSDVCDGPVCIGQALAPVPRGAAPARHDN